MVNAIVEAVEWMKETVSNNESSPYYVAPNRYLKELFTARIGYNLSDGPTSYEQAVRLGRQYLYSSK